MFRGLLEAVREAPEEDGLRLVLADWLEDDGQRARAELIRVQCRLARLDTRDPAYPELHLRQLEILAEHERDWLGAWADRLVHWQFERGLLTSITVEPGVFAQAAPLFAAHPVERVAFVDEQEEPLAPEAIRDVLSRDHIRHVRAIDASGGGPRQDTFGLLDGTIATGAWLRELARAQDVVRLEELVLFGCTRGGREPIEAEALGEFCSAAHLKSLARLDLSDRSQHEWHSAWPGLLRTLAAAPFGPNLRALRFHGCLLGDEAGGVLARNRAFAGLEKLDLGNCNLLGRAGVQAVLDSPVLGNLRDVTLPYAADLRLLAASPRLARWRSLALTGYANFFATASRGEEALRLGRRVAPTEWQALFASPHLSPARLSVSASAPLSPEAARTLATAPWARDLEELELSFYPFDGSLLAPLFEEREAGPTRLRSLNLPPSAGLFKLVAKWPGLAGLTDLAFPDEQPQGIETLLHSPYLSHRLAQLEISECCRSRAGVDALARCKGLAGLRHLGFGWNDLSGAKMAALVASPHLRHLESLHLGAEVGFSPEEENAILEALRILASPEVFPRLRDVAIGADTVGGGVEVLRRRFGRQLRVWHED